ncbi:MAG: DapH/DapD/GlmU-related protein, partial [Planctomycetota bacterium]
GAVVSANAKVGSHTAINFQALVGHDSVVGDDCRLNPGVKIGGRCRLGDRVFVGANSFLRQGICLGDDVTIDAMTYVDDDIPGAHIVSARKNKGRPLRRPWMESR